MPPLPARTCVDPAAAEAESKRLLGDSANQMRPDDFEREARALDKYLQVRVKSFMDYIALVIVTSDLLIIIRFFNHNASLLLLFPSLSLKSLAMPNYHAWLYPKYLMPKREIIIIWLMLGRNLARPVSKLSDSPSPLELL